MNAGWQESYDLNGSFVSLRTGFHLFLKTANLQTLNFEFPRTRERFSDK